MIECKGTYYITDNCYIDFDNSHIVINRVENQQIKLSNRGKIVLFVLTQNEGEIVSKNDLVYDVFNIKPKLPENRNEIAQIDTLISRLRKIPIISKCIETEYGVGFVFTNIHTIPSLKTSYTKKNSKTHNAFYNCPFYENREDLIQELQQFAFAVRPVHVISGERGMGKTELAKEYANACIANGDNDKNKAYENVIFASYSDNGLKDTVISLQCKGIRNKDDRYKMIIYLLGKLKEPSLLIIDNVDLSDSNDLSELSDKSECYMDLLNTKCHILLTSKTDLSTCHAIKQTVIKPHDIKILVQLFFKIMFNIEEKDPITTNVTIEKKIIEYSKHKNNERNTDYIELVTNLIDNILKKNTYLVTLVAKLSQIKDPYNIVKALMSDNANSLDDTVSAYKDGGHQEDTIINLYYKLIKISGIIDTDNSVQLLYNLALLPTSGIDYDVFFNNSFKTDTRTQLKRAFGKLINNYYVFKNEGIIYIHPFIREIILTKINRFKHSYIQEYVDFITKNIDVTNYDPNLIDNLTRAVALYSSLKKIGQVSLSYARLTAYIAYAYDIITNKQLAYQYGKHAIELLNQLDTSDLHKIDKLEKAKCLNQSGYSVLHNPNAEDRICLAFTAISGAEKLIETEIANLSLSENMHIEFDKLLTRVHGNLGACCLANNDFEKALDYHLKTKEYREKLMILEPNGTNNNMLATAYKNIGTDYYYISRSFTDEEKYNYLKFSYENHLEASLIFEKENSIQHRNTVISNNRLVGTAIMLLNEYFYLYKQKDDIKPPFENIISNLEIFVYKTRNNIKYLKDVKIITDEVRNCIKNISDLLSLMEARNISNENMLTNIIEAVDIASSIPNIDKSIVAGCYDIINRIAEANKIKIKEINK